jgi:quinoprotein glucose dehydrogenase
MDRVVRSHVALTVCAVTLATITASGQSGARNGEWRTYAGDLGSTRYSPLDQINAGNFGKLEIAWRFKTDKLGPRPEFQRGSCRGADWRTGATARKSGSCT